MGLGKRSLAIGFAIALGAQIAPAVAQDVYTEFGGRYWYSSGKINFAFWNMDPIGGDPTSTLDWTGLTAHSGEVFARVNHDGGLYLKGTIGAGTINAGKIIDRDFFVGQILFSDTYSEVRGNNLRYGTVDIGWGTANSWGKNRIGAFVGYLYWNEKLSANGIRCNPDDVGGLICGPPGSVPVPFSTAVFGYEPTAHGLRLGFDGRWEFAPGWSVSAEASWLPYVWLKNLDSHLLRTDLAPSPNIISNAKGAYGFTAEAFLNYAIMPNIEIGVGGRYWGVLAGRGDTSMHFADGTVLTFPVRTLNLQRWGLLVQLKGQL